MTGIRSINDLIRAENEWVDQKDEMIVADNPPSTVAASVVLARVNELESERQRLRAQIGLLRACVLAADAMRDELEDDERAWKLYDEARAKVEV